MYETYAEIPMTQQRPSLALFREKENIIQYSKF